jgi:2-C-methyl-D-erythritol 4-phosphate cytidylyltransferase
MLSHPRRRSTSPTSRRRSILCYNAQVAVDAHIGALVTAAGSGARFGAEKQFVALAGSERLVDAAVSTSRAVAGWVGVILPAGRHWDGAAVDDACAGGASRYESLLAGLARVPRSVEVLLVHSASHPLATVALAGAVLAAVAAGADGAVPVLDAVDVVKRHRGDGTITTVGRQGLGLAQSPMAFRREALDRAFDAVADGVEESQLVEAIGGRVVAVAGEVTNVHVVDQASLEMVRALARWKGDHRWQTG